MLDLFGVLVLSSQNSTKLRPLMILPASLGGVTCSVRGRAFKAVNKVSLSADGELKPTDLLTPARVIQTRRLMRVRSQNSFQTSSIVVLKAETLPR